MAPMQSKSWCFPGQLLVLMIAGWINRHQQGVIAFQREETKVLRKVLGGKRLRFTDGQRRRLIMERPHQGLDGKLIQPANDHMADGPLVKRERLGGLLNYYYREAA
jgi:hypothetical protein